MRKTTHSLLFLLIMLFSVISVVSFAQIRQQDSIIKDKIIQDVRIFPNPAIDDFKLKIDQEIGSISIYNILGKEVAKYRSTADHTYSVANLKRGIYIVRIFDEEKRLIKAMRLSKA